MLIKDIKQFIFMAMEGDCTIDRRLELVEKQRDIMQKRIVEISEMLDILKYKCWYYETAKMAGTTAVPRDMSDDEIPPKYVLIRKKLNNKH